MEKFSPETNDHLCRYFHCIVVNKLNETHSRPDAIRIAEGRMSGIGTNAKMREKFVENWESIEELYNNRPLHTFKIRHTIFVDGDGVETYGDFEVRGYSERKIQDELQHILFNLHKPKIV